MWTLSPTTNLLRLASSSQTTAQVLDVATLVLDVFHLLPHSHPHPFLLYCFGCISCVLLKLLKELPSAFCDHCSNNLPKAKWLPSFTCHESITALNIQFELSMHSTGEVDSVSRYSDFTYNKQLPASWPHVAIIFTGDFHLPHMSSSLSIWVENAYTWFL